MAAFSFFYQALPGCRQVLPHPLLHAAWVVLDLLIIDDIGTG
jgi:hypothetical protein